MNADGIAESGWKFRSDLQNSGVYDDGGDRPEALILWTFFTGEQVYSSPVVANDTVYFGGDEDKIYALNADTGTQIWNFTTTGASWSSPAVTNGIIYYGGLSKFYALNATTGDFLWDFSSGQVESSPAVADGIVYFGSNNHKVYALFADNGTQVWSFSTGEAVESSPAVVQNVVYIGSYDSKIYALNAVTGTKIWEFNTGSPIQSSPAVTNGTVYIGSWNGKIHAINADSGSEIWNFSASAQVDTSPAVANDVVYFGSRDHKVYAVNANTGTQIWSFDTGSMVLSSPSVANGVVYIAAVSKIYALNADTGTQIWSLTYGGGTSSNPAIANGLIYVGTQDNSLYAIGRTPPSPPANITNLHNTTYQQTSITWVWTDPADEDFDHVMVYVDGVFQENVTKGVQEYMATGLNAGTSYTISTRTVGTTGLTNETWVNHTASTSPPPPTLSYLDPLYVAEGSPAFTLNVYGVGFTGNSQIFWNGIGQTTQFLQPTQLSMEVPADQVAHQRMVNITVYDSSGGEFSNSLYFVVSGQPPSTPGWKFRSDLNNSGVYDDGGERPEGALLWSFPTSNRMSLCPAVVDKIVYVGGSEPPTFGEIYALDAETGSFIWKYSTGNWVESSPAVANGIVYVGCDDHKLYALNAETGALIWNYTTGGIVESSPGVANGIIYVGSNDHNLYALNAETGALIWNYTTGGRVRSSPAVANGIVYAGSDDNKLYALNAGTGALIWNYTTGDWVDSSPSVVNGIVYLASKDDHLYALNALTGAPIWSNTIGINLDYCPAVANGIVYIGDFNGNLYAFNATSGSVIWSYPTEGNAASSPAVANGVVYIGGYDLYALDAATGELLWNYPTSDYLHSNPVVANGIVYIGAGGQLYALGPYPEIPPASVTDLHNTTYLQNSITWVWTDPADGDFDHVMVYVNGVFQENVTAGEETFTATSLNPAAEYTIGTRTVGTTGLINATWVNQTSWTKALSPVANFAANATLNQIPFVVQFTDNSTGDDITSRLWSFGDGETSTEINPLHIYTAPGLFTVSLEVTNDGGSNTNTKTNYIRVFGTGPIADFIAEPESGNAPLTVQFYDTSVGLPTGWQWDFGDGTTSHHQSPSHIYTNPGNYTVTLTTGSSGGTNTTVKTDVIQVIPEGPPEVPVANFIADIWTGRFSAGADFYDASTGNPDSWNWSFGDGSYSNERNPWHIYQGIGSYPVSLTVSNSEGSDTITRDNFIVIQTPPPEADFSGSPRYGTFPLTVEFTDYSAGSVDWDTPPVTYEWDFGDGSPNSTQKGTVYHHYMAAGTYTVTLTVTDIGGTNTMVRENYIGEAPPPQPIADFTATPKSGYAPLTVDFIDQSTGSPLLTYTWDLGDGNASYERSPSHTYTQPGLYNISLITTNIGGSDTLTKAGFIEVLSAPEEPPLHADFTSNITAGTMPVTIQFLDTSTGNPSAWSWFFEKDSVYPAAEGARGRPIPVFGNELSHEKNPVVTYTYPGNYSVSLTVSRTGETDTITKDEYIRISPPAPEVDFSAYPAGGEAPLEVEFWENVPYAWYYDEFLWDFGDGTNGTGTWVYHTYENPGLYDVTLTVNSAYGSNSTTKTNFINVTRSEPPVPDFTGSPLLGYAPLDVVFTDTSTGMVTTRLWDFGDGTTAWENGTPTVPHTYSIPGTYTLTLTSGNDAGSNSITKAGYVHVNPSGTPPDARFILTPRMGNAPLTVQFTDRSGGMPLKWLWDFGDGTTSSEQNPSHTYTTPGRYLPKLTVYNSGGSDSSSSFVWIRSMKAVFPTYTPSPTITPLPTVPPVSGKSPISFFAINKSFGSAPMTVQFTDRSFNTPTSWQWDFDDGQTSTEQNPVNTFTDPGRYSVSLNVKNALGESTTSRIVYVR